MREQFNVCAVQCLNNARNTRGLGNLSYFKLSRGTFLAISMEFDF